MATLGLTTIDGSLVSILAWNDTSQVQSARRAGNVWTATENGTITSIHAYLGERGPDVPYGGIDVSWFVNEVDSVSADSHGEIASAETLGLDLSTDGWQSASASGTIINGRDYVISVTANPADLPDNINSDYVALALDTATLRNYYWESFTTYTLAKEDPWTDSSGSSTSSYSTYITYTPTTNSTVQGISTIQGISSIII